MRLLGLVCTATLAGLMFAGCGEKPQTASHRKADGRAYQGAAPAFTVPGWKAGDETSWDAQMKNRAQNQNEYSRATAP